LALSQRLLLVLVLVLVLVRLLVLLMLGLVRVLLVRGRWGIGLPKEFGLGVASLIGLHFRLGLACRIPHTRIVNSWRISEFSTLKAG